MLQESGRTEPWAGRRRRAVGAEPDGTGSTFRVWAPTRRRVSVVLADGAEHPLEPSPDGHHSGRVENVRAGATYRFRLDDDRTLYPDPASRYQPDGPQGPSQIVDPAAFQWSDQGWPGIALPGQVVYEMHVGTFTPQGTWAGAAEKLPFLKDVGISVIEVMPVAEFPGRFGWGYDGVDLYAPTRLYGDPDDLRAFIDAAHRIGIGVILDVVYNHLGPDGNYLACFCADYFSKRHETEWGEALNFDGDNSGPVRTFFMENAAYWIDEFHFDGLRLDATQSIFDDGPVHVLIDVAEAARRAAGPRSIIIVAENEPQHTRLVRPRDQGGYGLDALWNDDFHHSATVALTGRAEAYYEDHEGSPQEFISCAKYGYLLQGEIYFHQGAPRGTPGLDLPPAAFVTFIQNHDQVANSDSGLRFTQLAHPAQARAMTGLTLLMPGTPMLFQGQEFGATTPFFYFADHQPELAALVRNGRVEFMGQFPSVAADRALQDALPDPAAIETFERCRLDWSEAERNVAAVALHRDLLALRRRDAVLSRQTKGGVDGAVIGPNAFLLRFFGDVDGDRLLLANFGNDLVRRSIPEPLLAPPLGCWWSPLWSSEDSRYGGHGTPRLSGEHGWRIPAHSCVLLKSQTAG